MQRPSRIRNWTRQWDVFLPDVLSIFVCYFLKMAFVFGCLHVFLPLDFDRHSFVLRQTYMGMLYSPSGHFVLRHIH